MVPKGIKLTKQFDAEVRGDRRYQQGGKKKSSSLKVIGGGGRGGGGGGEPGIINSKGIHDHDREKGSEKKKEKEARANQRPVKKYKEVRAKRPKGSNPQTYKGRVSQQKGKEGVEGLVKESYRKGRLWMEVKNGIEERGGRKVERQSFPAFRKKGEKVGTQSPAQGHLVGHVSCIEFAENNVFRETKSL